MTPGVFCYGKTPWFLNFNHVHISRFQLQISVLNYTANGERKHGEESLAKVKKEAYMQVQEIEEFGSEIAKKSQQCG